MLFEAREFDFEAQKFAQQKWNSIAKPLYGLGKLEKAISKMAGIFHSYGEIDIDKAALVIMCADHGIVNEGVTQTDSSVTKIVTDNFQNSKTTATVMSRFAGVDVFPVDVGINCKRYENKKLMPFVVTDKKIRRGTGNISVEPAMTAEECQKAIQVGIDIVENLAGKGYKIIASGEMGIGNTTPSSVLCSVLLGLSAESSTGRGAGIDDAGYLKKIEIVKKSAERIAKNFTGNYIELLADGGGIEIAAMCGLFIGGAVYGIPVIIDGFISSISALFAIKLCKECKNYILASHVSNELSGRIVLEKLQLDSYIDCEMCLGEGTGAVAAIPLFRMAAEVYNKMCTFESVKIKPYIDYKRGM